MATYLLIIVISVLFTYWAECSRKNRSLFLFFSFWALFIPAFFAGCRDLTVGFDVMFYEYDIYKSAHYSNSFFDLLSSDVGSIEPLFLLINYLTVLIIDDIHFVLGVISFVTLYFAYCACFKMNKVAPSWLLFTCFLLLNYASSMNIIRQSLAISICLYAYSLMKTSALNSRFYIAAFLAVLVHRTALLPIGLLIIYFYLSNMDEKKFSSIFLLYIIGMAILFATTSYILPFLSNLFNKDFEIYLDGSMSDKSWAQSFVSTAYVSYLTIFIIVCYWGYKKKIIFATDIHEYKCNAASIALCILLAASFTGSMLRLIAYFIAISVIELASILLNKKIKTYKRNIFVCCIIVLFLILFMKEGYYDGLDYSSKILGI